MTELEHDGVDHADRDIRARGASSIFDAQRLRVARHIERLTGRELAEKVGVSPTSVSQWESGTTRPRSRTVTRLSEALGFPVEYFATSGRHAQNLDSECSFFRSLRESRQRDRDAAAGHAALIAELLLVIERWAKLPHLEIPDLPVPTDATWRDIDAVAQSVRDRWGLGLDPIEDVVVEIERHGGTTVRLELADDVDAFSWAGYGRPIVILGVKKKNRMRSRFDAAHELGHLVMHGRREPNEPGLEKQAHRFANAFLWPADAIDGAAWEEAKVDWRALMEIKHRWQMSLAAILYRARQDHLIAETTYASATRYLARAGWSEIEPGDEGLPERPRLLEHAAQALRTAGLNIEDLAREARLPERLVREYVTPAVPRKLELQL